MKENIILTVALIFFSTSAFAQKTIKGTVVSKKDGIPIGNVTVHLKGTQIKVATNDKGGFEIPASSKDQSVVISSVGYETNTLSLSQLSGSQNIVYMQESSSMLEEVVVSTGYEKIPKERATGSFSQIDNKRLNEQVGTNIMDRLPAIANSYGVTSKRTNANNYITIRGFSTLTGPRNPLIVVDDFPYEGDINNINPNEVENITFLKDAAAASIWGTRAGNGVIVITTKKGRHNQPVKLEFNSTVSILEKPDLHKISTISSSDYIDMERVLFENKYRFSDTSNVSRPSFTPVYEILFKMENGTISTEEGSRQINALKNFDVRDDYMKYVYRTGINQQYSLGARGGTENLTWLISGGYDKNVGRLDEKYDRLNLRTENSYKLNRKTELTAGFHYTQSHNISGRPAYNSISTGTIAIPTYSRLADEEGNPLPIYKRRQHYVETAGDGKLLDWNYYPLNDYRQSTTSTSVQDLLANFGLRYSILQGLTLGVKYQYERQNLKTEILNTEDSYYSRDLINNFTQIDPASGTVIYKVPKGDIQDRTNNVMTSYNLRGQLNYNRKVNDHEISFLAGAEIREIKNDIDTYRTYGLNREILTSVPVDYANAYPQYTTGFSSFIPNTANLEGTKIRYVSLFGNLSYNYRSRYILSGSVRRDASNSFGVATNDKWNPLWSAGLGWNLSEEPFYKVDFMPYLKLRATYGYSGNVDPSKTALTTIKYGSTSPYTQSPITDVERFYNPELRWEKVRMTNFGMDFRLRGNRVSGSIEYFRKKATDLYGSVPLDLTVGLRTATITKNIAEIRGNGVDIELNSENLKGRLQWATNLNLSLYKDEVLKNYTGSYIGSNFVGGGMFAVEGKPLYSLFAYKWLGISPSNGNPVGYINGHRSEDYLSITGDSTQLSDLVYKGSLIPTLYGSIGNTFRWKNLSLTLRVSYAFGHYFRNESINYSNLLSNGTGHADYGSRWQNPGDEAKTNIPSWIYPVDNNRDAFYSYSEVLTLKGDNIRLQYINLSYDLPEAYRKRLRLSNLKIFCTASNLGIIWRANGKGADPDYPNTAVPPSPTFSFGMNIGL
ncbi:SusC/RagA family TonB-linked outer membrane protein [Sphingobacterium thalpophilum]|uniref:SusC/RagA family TonB-linked outer membrane protein n=1 Tax=Sphingobacterium thalpophilum TaxID=259 RepID=UPI003DA4870E